MQNQLQLSVPRGSADNLHKGITAVIRGHAGQAEVQGDGLAVGGSLVSEVLEREDNHKVIGVHERLCFEKTSGEEEEEEVNNKRSMNGG